MFTLEQLRGFVAVAEELHFGRAAERLQMTQPPLTRTIQKLERSVGAHLLDRDNRTVELTAAGAAFLVESRRLLGLADHASEQARRIEAGSAGTVRLGFTATSTIGVLPRLLDHWSSTFPAVHLELRELVTTAQASALVAEELDLGLARPPFDTATFGSHLLHRENLVLAVPRAHRLAGRDRVSPADAADEPLIMYAPVDARYFHDLVVRLLPVSEPQIVHSVSQVMTMLWLVAGGRGIAFVPESAARMTIPDVEFLTVTGLPDRPVELHLLWSADARNPAARALVDGVRTVSW